MGAGGISARAKARRTDGGGASAAPANAWGEPEPDAGRSGRARGLVSATADAWVGAIEAVVGAGLGLVVSGTSDGGAVRIAVLVDGDTRKKYAGDAETLKGLLTDLQAYAGGLAAGGGTRQP